MEAQAGSPFNGIIIDADKTTLRCEGRNAP
jgi:hypothetical protein